MHILKKSSYKCAQQTRATQNTSKYIRNTSVLTPTRDLQKGTRMATSSYDECETPSASLHAHRLRHYIRYTTTLNTHLRTVPRTSSYAHLVARACPARHAYYGKIALSCTRMLRQHTSQQTLRLHTRLLVANTEIAHSPTCSKRRG